MLTTARPHVQILIGSVREGRASGPVARWVADRFEDEFGRPAEVVDLRDWMLPDFNLSAAPAMGSYPDRRQRAWAATIARADAFICVVPEYNHGYSAALKNAFDWIYDEWAGKPAIFVSFGNAHGSRAIQQIKQVMGELRMVPVEPSLALRPHGHLAGRQFDGTPEDARRLSRSLGELLLWEEALRPLRKPVAAPRLARRVIVIGLDAMTNRSVVSPLMAAGIDAHGLVLGDHDPVPDCEGYDMVAIGRGAAGKVADAVRAAVYALNPLKPVIDVIGPLAVRQILAASDSSSPKLVVQEMAIDGRHLSLVVSGDDGRVGVTAFERVATGLIPHQVAVMDLRGKAKIELVLPVKPYSLVVDLDGAAFYHRAVK